MAKRQIIGGGFQSPSGHYLNGGKLTFRLNTDTTTGNQQVTAGRVTEATLGATGSVVGTVALWPNDQLSPANNVYIVKAYTAEGQKVWEQELSLTSASGPYSLV